MIPQVSNLSSDLCETALLVTQLGLPYWTARFVRQSGAHLQRIDRTDRDLHAGVIAHEVLP